MKKSLFFLFFLFLLADFYAKGEEEYDYEKALKEMEYKERFGIFYNFNFNYQSTNFQNLPNVPSCCPNYKNGSGNGFQIGGLFEKYFRDKFYYGARIGFHNFFSSFSSLEDETFIIDGSVYPGKIEHLIDVEFSRFFITPSVIYSPEEKLFITLGADLSFIVNANYKQIEKIKDPPDKVTFSDGLRYRNKNDGNLKESNNFNFGLNLGTGYEFILNSNGSLRFMPEIYYSIWFLPLIKEKEWLSQNLNVGVALKYIQPPPPPPPPLPPKAPPLLNPNLPELPPKLLANVSVVEIDTNNNEKNNFAVKIEDFTSLSLRPLLNYIFFDHNSSDIPERYVKLKRNEINYFSLNQLINADALQTYYNVLNIIGLRLHNNPDINIELVGTNSNKAEEKNNKKLSQERAEKVRDYFVNIWNIDPKRITVSARNLPKEATLSDEEGADDENRRVEINSDSPVLSEPVVTGDTLRMVSNSKLRFYLKPISPIGIKEWTLTIKHKNEVIKTLSGEGAVPDFVDWQINNEDKYFQKVYTNLTYTLSLKDLINQTYETKPQIIPIDQITIDRKRLEKRADREFEYYRLILFDYASSNLRDEHKKVLDLVKSRIKPNSNVKIKGYTDRIGKENVNMRIATLRANSVARYLNLKNASVIGIGENELIYDNNLPEGRFYCRTVTIDIETPVIE